METKKLLFTAMVSLTTALAGMAQTSDNDSYVNPKETQSAIGGNNIFSVGFGSGGNYPYTGSMYVQNPNLSVAYENNAFKNVGPGNITIGGLMAYESIYSGYTDNVTGYMYSQHWNYYVLGTRVAYNLNPFSGNKHIETYAGAMLGYYITKYHVTSTDPNYNEPDDPGYSLSANNYPNFMALSVFAGVRSWFNNKECIWLEVGYGYTSFEFGLSYKI